MDNLKNIIQEVESRTRYLDDITRTLKGGKNTNFKVSSNNGYHSVTLNAEYDEIIKDALEKLYKQVEEDITPLRNKLNTLNELVGE